MAGDDSAGRLFVAFRKVIAAVVLFNDQVAQATGLSASDAQFLHLLQLHGAMTPSSLGAMTGLASGTVTGVVDRLEELGFVRREKHPSDRRKVLVVLDEQQVRARLDPLYADQAQALARAVESFSPRERTVIARFLEALDPDGTRAEA